MPECHACGFPISSTDAHCPKCETPASLHPNGRNGRSGILEVDVVHHGESWAEAHDKIDRALDQALYERRDALKIIHGYGSHSGGRSVIAPRARAHLHQLARQFNGRFTEDRFNPGASLIWLNW